MPSHFIWNELLTSDPDAAAAFYGSVLDWKAHDSGQPGMDYRIITMNGTGVGGRMVEFRLAGQRIQALNGGPQFRHSEAMSLSISAKDAAEVDRYWNALTASGGTEGQCGWVNDRFGVSWQVVPEGLGALMSNPDPARGRRAMPAMMRMTKLDLAAMRAAAQGD